MRCRLVVILGTLVLPACGDDGPAAPEGTAAYFDLDATGDEDTYFNFPFPSDLRLLPDGKPDLEAYPNPRNLPILEDLLEAARDRHKWSVMPVAYLRFDAPLAPRDWRDVVPADPGSPVLLVDIDPDSPDRGALVPTVALTMVIDDYAPEHVLAIAPRPGFVLHGERTYAFVVMRGLNDAEGAPLAVPDAFAALAAGEVPDTAWGAEAADLYGPLWDTLDQLGVARDQVAVATVFTTADVVAETAALSDAVLAAHSVTIDDLVIDPDDGASHDRYCELVGTVTFPQFQRGTAPYDREGHFELDADGLPIVQGADTVPVVITIPKQEMPAAGYPLMMYFHGSGGTHNQVVDRGPVTAPGGQPTKGQGPAHLVAAFGIGAAGSAHPVNPERVPGASSIEYLNFNNLSAFRDLFRQGVIEQRLYLDALLELRLDPALLADCTGPTLPGGATTFQFDPDKVVVSGQSMGGMYANLVGAVDPRIKAAVPTGAGGFWNLMILETDLIEGVRDLLSALIKTPEPDLTFMHPAMALIGLGWEPAEPFVSMPRLARRPLPGHPVRPIYQPVAPGDTYFSTGIFDAAAIAYGNHQVGDVVWEAMQEALALAGLDGIVGYPVLDNLTSETGESYTGVVAQYEGDGTYDPHVIALQREDVMYQYGCFLDSFLTTGTATVPAPADLGSACP
jgi:hypothetical protein